METENKKFTDRLNAKWNSAEVLSEILDQYFEDPTTLKTRAGLCYYLNISELEFEKRKRLPPYAELLGLAELALRVSIERVGFVSDRSFAKFILETQHGYTKNPVSEDEEKGKTLSITLNEVRRDA